MTLKRDDKKTESSQWHSPRDLGLDFGFIRTWVN
jgi:hypothetical protein